MLPQPIISSPPTQAVLPVGFVGGGNPYSGTADSVQSGAWLTSSGEVGVVLIDIGATAVDFALPVDFARWALVGGQRYAVTLSSDGSVQSLGTITASSSFGISLQPMQIALVTIQTPTVVEFYNGDLDNFFITSDPSEQTFVDSGAVGRWQRTGNTFKASGPSQVCRFYGNSLTNPTTGVPYGPNSHFYTADANECSTLKAHRKRPMVKISVRPRSAS
jgi:hypothetical protein